VKGNFSEVELAKMQFLHKSIIQNSCK